MQPHTNESRMTAGQRFLATMWSEIASRVIEISIGVYQLSPEQAAALRTAFLRRVQFEVEAV